MRDPLPEPRTRPVSLRWGTPPAPTITYGGCPEDESEEHRRRWPETPAFLGEPVTLRDLIRAARAARAHTRRGNGANTREWWTATHRVAAERIGSTWRIELQTYRPVPYVYVELRDPSIDQITTAGRLCGWDTGRLL